MTQSSKIFTILAYFSESVYIAETLIFVTFCLEFRSLVSRRSILLISASNFESIAVETSKMAVSRFDKILPKTGSLSIFCCRITKFWDFRNASFKSLWQESSPCQTNFLPSILVSLLVIFAFVYSKFCEIDLPYDFAVIEVSSFWMFSIFSFSFSV